MADATGGTPRHNPSVLCVCPGESSACSSSEEREEPGVCKVWCGVEGFVFVCFCVCFGSKVCCRKDAFANKVCTSTTRYLFLCLTMINHITAIDRTTPCPAAVQPFSSERGRKKRVLWETLVLDWGDHAGWNGMAPSWSHNRRWGDGATYRRGARASKTKRGDAWSTKGERRDRKRHTRERQATRESERHIG